MPRMTNFIYCLSAERMQAMDGKGDSINAMGVLAAMTPEFVPGTFSYSIVFSILDVDITQDNRIQIRFKDNNNKEIIDTGVLSIPRMPDAADGVGLPKEYKGLNLSMDFRNVVFETEGLYTTEVYFNEELLSENPIYVKGKR